jgi:hypothetical protein
VRNGGGEGAGSRRLRHYELVVSYCAVASVVVSYFLGGLLGVVVGLVFGLVTIPVGERSVTPTCAKFAWPPARFVPVRVTSPIR